MSWAVGYDSNWQRDIGYGVPAMCDHPGCKNTIHRGLSYVCGGEPYGGEHGCGLYFCPSHLSIALVPGVQLCDRCFQHEDPFTPTPDLAEWTNHKMTDPSWAHWRRENGAPTT